MADPLRRRARAWTLGALTRAAPLVPPPLLRALLGSAAALARRGPLGRRARANLELAFGDELPTAERERILRACFRHSAGLAETWLRLARGAPPQGAKRGRGGWIDSLVAIDDSIEHLEAALAGGRGAIVVTAHLGDWELLCAALRRRGTRGSVVGLERRRDPSSHWLVDLRRAYGVETIPQAASPRRALEVLGRGEVLGLLTDLEVRRLAGVFVPFFGRPALTMSAPAALARASGAPLVPARCVRTADGRYLLSAELPLRYDRSLGRAAATRTLLESTNATFEGWIREHPGQWSWHQHRWRTAPGEYEVLPLPERIRRSDGSPA